MTKFGDDGHERNFIIYVVPVTQLTLLKGKSGTGIT